MTFKILDFRDFQLSRFQHSWLWCLGLVFLWGMGLQGAGSGFLYGHNWYLTCFLPISFFPWKAKFYSIYVPLQISPHLPALWPLIFAPGCCSHSDNFTYLSVKPAFYHSWLSLLPPAKTDSLHLPSCLGVLRSSTAQIWLDCNHRGFGFPSVLTAEPDYPNLEVWKTHTPTSPTLKSCRKEIEAFHPSSDLGGPCAFLKAPPVTKQLAVELSWAVASSIIPHILCAFPPFFPPFFPTSTLHSCLGLHLQCMSLCSLEDGAWGRSNAVLLVLQIRFCLLL